MNEYTIICPECGCEMDDTNRISSTVREPYKGMPGGEAYVYTYRCPACISTITWTYETKKPTVHIHVMPEGE